MQNEIHSLKILEKMNIWRATFKIVASRGSPKDLFVCLMKDIKGGYFWKQPDNPHVEKVDLVQMKKSIENRRLHLVSGKIPRLPKVESV